VVVCGNNHKESICKRGEPGGTGERAEGCLQGVKMVDCSDIKYVSKRLKNSIAKTEKILIS
jgi:hypothetical protein